MSWKGCSEPPRHWLGPAGDKCGGGGAGQGCGLELTRAMAQNLPVLRPKAPWCDGSELPGVMVWSFLGLGGRWCQGSVLTGARAQSSPSHQCHSGCREEGVTPVALEQVGLALLVMSKSGSGRRAAGSGVDGKTGTGIAARAGLALQDGSGVLWRPGDEG